MLALYAGSALWVAATVVVSPWAPIFQGVEAAQGEADAAEPRLQQVNAMRVDLQAPGVELFSTPGGAPPPKETHSETTSEFLVHYHLQAAINGNFFEPCCAPGDKDLEGLAISRGVVVSPPVAKGNGSKVLVVTRDNHASIMSSAAGFVTAPYWTAVAGSAIVLVGGAKPALPATKFNTEIHPRTAVGVSRDGRYLILLVIDGRQPGYSMGATMDEVADWLLRFGASEGLNLDGGGSTALVREAEGGHVAVLNRPSGVALGSSDNAGKAGEERQQRSNGNNLGVFARPLSRAAQPPR
jgi:phosphodiester glycosidase